MSGSFVHSMGLTGGAGYKANPTYDDFLRKHSGFYRRHSQASAALDEDRRRSSAGIGSDAAQAVSNVQGEGAAAGTGTAEPRRGSIAAVSGGAAVANTRKGSVVVASDATRRDSVFGMESSAGVVTDPSRRLSTSLASDLLHKMRGSKSSGGAH